MKYCFSSQLTNRSQQRNLREESKKHGDILQATKFLDAYHNITLRDIVGFKWVLKNCPRTEFIMKADDDVALNVYYLIDTLETNRYTNSKKLVACANLIHGATVLRYGHYAVSYEDFPTATYPDYCSGWWYILRPDSLSILMNMTTMIQPIWMNDVYFTGILTQAAGISLTNLKFGFTFSENEVPGIIEREETHLYQLLPINSNPDLMRNIQSIFHNQSMTALAHRFSDEKTHWVKVR